MDLNQLVNRRRDNGDADLGSCLLQLVHQAAETSASTEARLQSELEAVFDQLTGAEANNRVLKARVLMREARAAEAEQWLQRIHEKLDAEAKRMSVLVQDRLEARRSTDPFPVALLGSGL